MHLSIDGGPVPATQLQVVKAAGQVPGHPEADQFGALAGFGGQILDDLGVQLGHRGVRGGEGLGDDILVEVVVIAPPAVEGDTGPFGRLALVAPESWSSAMAAVCRIGATSPPASHLGSWKSAGRPPFRAASSIVTTALSGPAKASPPGSSAGLDRPCVSQAQGLWPDDGTVAGTMVG